MEKSVNMMDEAFKNLNDTQKNLREFTSNFKHLNIKKKKTFTHNGHKIEATLTEGAMILIQFKTLTDAEQYFNSL